MWFVIETVYYVGMDDSIPEGLFGAYATEQDAQLIADSMRRLDAENERWSATYTVMSAEMF